MTRLFHVSDLHFGREDRAALDWFARCVEDERPEAIAITGDLTMRARQREFDAACDWILSLTAPVTVEVGNHDLPYFNPLARFFFPYRRFRRIEALVERELALPGITIVPLKTTARAQWRFNWSKGWVTPAALEHSLSQVDALPAGTRALITAHHPLVEAGTKGNALTRGGERALTELARRNVAAVLTGHVHDAFDLVKATRAGAVRMIGAGTLSQRLRSTPPSFNELTFDGDAIHVRVRSLVDAPTEAMLIDEVPPNAEPPGPDDPVAPIGRDQPPGGPLPTA